MTKDEFKNAVKRLAEWRKVETREEKVDILYETFENKEMASVLLMCMYIMSNHIEDWGEIMIQDWDDEDFQQFMKVCETYGPQWAEFLHKGIVKSLNK